MRYTLPAALALSAEAAYVAAILARAAGKIGASEIYERQADAAMQLYFDAAEDR